MRGGELNPLGPSPQGHIKYYVHTHNVSGDHDSNDRTGQHVPPMMSVICDSCQRTEHGPKYAQRL